MAIFLSLSYPINHLMTHHIHLVNQPQCPPQKRPRAKKHFSNITKSVICQPRSISKIASFFSFPDTQTLLVFVSSNWITVTRYWPQKSINYLPFEQSAATRKGNSQRIASMLTSPHWSPVAFRNDVKVLRLVFKAEARLASGWRHRVASHLTSAGWDFTHKT